MPLPNEPRRLTINEEIARRKKAEREARDAEMAKAERAAEKTPRDKEHWWDGFVHGVVFSLAVALFLWWSQR